MLELDANNQLAGMPSKPCRLLPASTCQVLGDRVPIAYSGQRGDGPEQGPTVPAQPHRLALWGALLILLTWSTWPG